MTIRKRIWLIYLVSVFVPVFILAGSLLYMSQTIERHMGEEADLIRDTYTNDPVDRMMSGIEKEIVQNPKVLNNKNYVAFLTSAIQMTPFEVTIYKDEDKVLSVNQQRFYREAPIKLIREGTFADKAGVSYNYEVTIRERKSKNGFLKRFNARLMKYSLLFIIAYGIIHLIFFKYAIRTVFSPLAKMKSAAMDIRDEQYDQPLVYEGQDEVGQVFQAFDEMRLRIKDTDRVRRQYEENRKELIANISHDLKTPITAINGYVQGILDGVANTEEKRQSYVETIAVYGRDMDTLINDLSLLSNLDLDGVVFHHEVVNMVDYIKDCVEELSFDLKERGIFSSLRIHIDDHSQVFIDTAQIKRVLNNIIYNAVRHFDKETALLEIDLEESDEKGYWLVIIKDNGTGIPKNQLENVFDRFYRGDASRNSETGGSGLGLSIAQQIIRAHGGSIWAESEEGIGTTIGFTLPQLKEA